MSHHYCYKTVTILLLSIMLIAGCKKQEIFTPNPTNGRTTAVFNTDLTYGTVSDVDGNIYKTIVIGTQTWMAENLRTTHYQNGDIIPETTDSANWTSTLKGAYRNYNDSQNNDTIATYGRFYNGYTVFDNRKLAPLGWHIPSQIEWKILHNNVTKALPELTEKGVTHWAAPNKDATNESGFTALPGGFYSRYSGNNDKGAFGEWWSCNMYDSFNNNTCFIDNDIYMLTYENLNCGVSIRCIKD